MRILRLAAHGIKARVLNRPLSAVNAPAIRRRNLTAFQNLNKNMPSNSEKTHAKNLENLHIANATIATVPNYDSTNPIIVKAELVDYETGFSTRMQAVNAAHSAEQVAIAAQTAAFKLVPERVTMIINAAKGQSLPPESLAHLMTTVRRLRGVRVTDKTPDNPATPEDESAANHSVSRRSIAGILESLDLLDEQIKAEAGYKPNEKDVKSADITAWVASLRALRNARLDAAAATTNAREDRDDYGYNKTTGLIARMNAMKSYALTIMKKTDPRYKKLKGLKFVDPTNK